MKIFVVFLVSALVVCSAASGKNDMKMDKNQKKLGLPEFHSGEFSFQPAYGHLQQGALVNFATPLQAAGPLASQLPVTFQAAAPAHLSAGQLPFAFQSAAPAHLQAAPLPIAFQGPLQAAQLPFAFQSAAPAHLQTAQLPVAFQAAAPAHFQVAQLPVAFQSAVQGPLPLGLPAAPLPTPLNAVAVQNTHQVPVQFRTLVKNIPVPYERHIPIDNPIYTNVEQHVKIDNPVPVVKYVTQEVPIHVEQQVPIIKEERVPEPYLHKVPLVIQHVQVQEQPQQTYLPPQQQSPVYSSPQPLSAPAPYGPQQQQQHHQQQQQFRASQPAPPSTNYGVPQH